MALERKSKPKRVNSGRYCVSPSTQSNTNTRLGDYEHLDNTNIERKKIIPKYPIVSQLSLPLQRNSRPGSRNLSQENKGKLSTYKIISEQLGKVDETTNFGYLESQGLTFRKRRSSNDSESEVKICPQSNKGSKIKKSFNRESKIHFGQIDRFTGNLVLQKKKAVKESVLWKLDQKRAPSMKRKGHLKESGMCQSLSSIQNSHAILKSSYGGSKERSRECINSPKILKKPVALDVDESQFSKPSGQKRTKGCKTGFQSILGCQNIVISQEKIIPRFPDRKERGPIDSPTNLVRQSLAVFKTSKESKKSFHSPSTEIQSYCMPQELTITASIERSKHTNNKIDRSCVQNINLVSDSNFERAPSKSKSTTRISTRSFQPSFIKKKDILKILKMHRNLQDRVITLQHKLGDTKKNELI